MSNVNVVNEVRTQKSERRTKKVPLFFIRVLHCAFDFIPRLTIALPRSYALFAGVIWGRLQPA